MSGAAALPDENQSKELERLRDQVTELTQRVFRLEQMLEGGVSAGYALESLPYPTMHLEGLAESRPLIPPSPQLARPAETATSSDLALRRLELSGEPTVVSRMTTATNIADMAPDSLPEILPSEAPPPEPGPIELRPPESRAMESAPLKPLTIGSVTAEADVSEPVLPEAALNQAAPKSSPREPAPKSVPTEAVPVESPARARVESLAASASPEKSKPKRQVTSLESRVGGQWLNRAGIIAMLVGLSYFLKLAFDNNWIGPPVRIGIGLAIGIGLLLWSESFRSRGFAAFAYSLKAIGIGALYLSLWAAFQFYHLLPPTVAFGAMVCVTVASAVLSFRQNSELLGLFALLGGFLTPVLISSHQNQELELFGYVSLLDVGMLWIVAIKGWPRILLGGFIGTVLLFESWAMAYYTEPQLPLTLGFASGFFVLYAAAPLLVRATGEGKRSVSMVLLALANVAVYFAACYRMLSNYRPELAWLSAGIALVYFALASVAQRRNQLSRLSLVSLYLALAIGFLTIAVPLAFGRDWITLGWIIEGGAIIWAAEYTERWLLRVLGVCALALGVARLILLESNVAEPLVFNERFGLYLLAIGALALLAYFTLHEQGGRNRQWVGGAIISMNILALTALHFEIVGYFGPQLYAGVTRGQEPNILTVFDFTYSAVWMIYSSLLLLVGFWKHSSLVRWQGIVLLTLTVGKVFFSDIHMLERFYRIAAFVALGLILLVVSYFYQRNRAKTAA